MTYTISLVESISLLSINQFKQYYPLKVPVITSQLIQRERELFFFKAKNINVNEVLHFKVIACIRSIMKFRLIR